MDDELEKLLSNPFDGGAAKSSGGDAGFEGDKSAILRSIKEHAQDITSRAVHDYSGFRSGVDVVLRPHISSGELIQNRLFSDGAPARVQELVAPHAGRFRVNFEELSKTYRTYVETAVEEVLAREAERLRRRYFQSEATPEQLDFIKFKRFYEKIKTFNEIAKKDWREIQKFIDTFSVISETRSLVADIENEHLRNINLLMRQTDSFLDALKLHMQVEEETLDQITGSWRVVATYSPDVRYTMPAFFGDERVEQPDENVDAGVPDDDGSETQGSIARNIVIESREHKLNRASVFSAKLLGSRDWNRTPHYSFEVPVAYYDECLDNFKKAYQVNIDPNDVKGPMNTAAALVRAGEGKSVLNKYVTMVHHSLEEITDELTNKDFPGLEKPLVFLYHAGPGVMYRTLLTTFNRRRIGEMFYLDGNTNNQEIPAELVKKELIDWWNDKMESLTGEEVDSYLTYSRALEMVKKDYRALYDEGGVMRKKEQPGANYFGLEKWMKQNRTRVFGLRKVEVFKRFLNNTILSSWAIHHAAH